MNAPSRFESLDDAVTALLSRINGPLKIGAPLGLGKPHRLLNALYARMEGDPSRSLSLYTALSLDPPRGRSLLEKRFLEPFVERLYGRDFPRLAYVAAQKRDALPAHIEVEEFYLQSGALLGSTQAQRCYASLNYTHVARALADHDTYWHEDPVRMDSLETLKAYAPHSRAMICASETLAYPHAFRDYLATGVAGIAMLDLSWCGGLSEARKIAGMAEACQIPAMATV